MQKTTDMSRKKVELSILKNAVENANEAFVTIDHKSIVLFFNKAAEQIFGFERNEVIGRDLGHILGPMCREGHNLAVSRYVETKKPKLIGHETEFLAQRKNGETFPASISFSVAEKDGELFFTGIVRDLTETKILQRQLLEKERLATLGQTVAEISHEIKNPLLLIGGMARQLRRTADGAKSQEKLDTIVREVQRLENLLAELRDLYTPRHMTREKINIGELLLHIHSLIKEDSETKNINVLLADHTGQSFVEGDREKLQQVLLNVVKNGLEALTDGGELSIQSQNTGEMVEITVTDAGPGIPEHIQDKIFSPFFTTKRHGTGLGLCVARRIIEDHAGGSLVLVSKEGKGTTVKISLARLPQ